MAKWLVSKAVLNSAQFFALFMKYHCWSAMASIKEGKRMEKNSPLGLATVGP